MILHFKVLKNTPVNWIKQSETDKWDVIAANQPDFIHFGGFLKASVIDCRADSIIQFNVIWSCFHLIPV